MLKLETIDLRVLRMKRSSVCLVIAALVTIAGAVESGCKAKPDASASSQTAAQPVARTITAVSHLFCPHLGSNLAKAQQSNSGHRVILSWKASEPANSKHADAVGYCVYRGSTEKFPDTELLNAMPFAGTRCTDDSVEGGKKYYYVVRAISARGVTSDVTKPPVPAKIPASPAHGSKIAQDSPPLCRESVGTK
jgi:hypothetical protein